MANPRDVKLQDVIAGSVLGVALGDALGLPVEGSTHKQCVDYVAAVKGAFFMT